MLAIVKKNGPRLRALKRWLFGARPELLAAAPCYHRRRGRSGERQHREARSPAETINRLIREIVNGLPKSAYVGYTATPFANVLIDPTDYADLYPRDFIVDLPRPEIYIGPEAIFGREPLEFDAEDVEDDGHDFIRSVRSDELDGLRPKGSASRHEFEPEVTDSLDEALWYFLLSTAARRVRGNGNPHATALVHTSQHIDVHERMADAIMAHLAVVANRLARGDQALLEYLEDCGSASASAFRRPTSGSRRSPGTTWLRRSRLSPRTPW